MLTRSYVMMALNFVIVSNIIVTARKLKMEKKGKKVS